MVNTSNITFVYSWGKNGGIFVEFKDFRADQGKDKTVRWHYCTTSFIRQSLKRLHEEALFLPRGLKSFPETAVQGQHPEVERTTPGGGRNQRWADVSRWCRSTVSGPESSKGQQWFGVFYSYRVCLTCRWQILDIIL